MKTKNKIFATLLLTSTLLINTQVFAKTYKRKPQVEQFRGKEVVDKEGKKAEYYDDIYLCDYQGFKFTATTDDELKKIITESGLKLIDVKTASFKANQKLMILTVER